MIESSLGSRRLTIMGRKPGCGHCKMNKSGYYRRKCRTSICYLNLATYDGPRKVGVCKNCNNLCKGFEDEVTFLQSGEPDFFDDKYNEELII